MASSLHPPGQTLLIDADDTLWENNVYFERVISAYCELMDEHGFDRTHARSTLNAIEIQRTKVTGYGVKSFLGSFMLACQQLLTGVDDGPALARIEALCGELADQHPEVMTGVEETLRELSVRHRLILFTKGDHGDQLRKLERSALAALLHHHDVVREKDVEAYHDVIARFRIPTETGWMVGNSPKSDILPALAAGLGAVFIPHHATWELEIVEMPGDPHPRLITLERFSDLLKYF
jgi:putative hydrolase of the HAD superfamily